MFMANRSKSTTKTRPNKDEDRVVNNLPLQTISNVQKKSGQENYREGFAYKFLHRGGSSPRGAVGATKSGRSVPAVSSPSAWALSPGRSMVAPESPGFGRAKVKPSGGGGGVGGVLKYFRQKKVSPIQEEEYHQFRVLHNKLMQWRFANAKAEAAMDATKEIAEVRIRINLATNNIYFWIEVVEAFINYMYGSCCLKYSPGEIVQRVA